MAECQRESRVGREFDSLNLGWIWQTFRRAFRGEAKTIGGWYRIEIRGLLRRLLVPILITVALGVIGYWISYQWATVSLPKLLSSATSQDLVGLVKGARQSAGFVGGSQHLSALFLFGNNIRATFLIFLGGLVSFSVLGMLAYLVNFGLIGGVLGVFKILGYSPLLFFVAGLLPHGIFEIPALILSSAVVLWFGAVLVTPQIGKSMGQVVLESLADWAKLF